MMKKLVPRSEAQRQQSLEKTYSELLKIESKPVSVLAGVTNNFSMALGGSGSTVYHLSSYLKNKQSSVYEKQPSIGEKSLQAKNIYAELPDTVASDPNTINRINRAGELFILHGQCPPINKLTRTFKQVINSVTDVDALVKSITAALSMITVTTEGGVIKFLCTNANDLTEVFAKRLNGLLNSTSINDKIDQEWHSPLVTPENSVSWMKCKFSTELTIKDCCWTSRKEVELSLQCYAFFFSSVNDFDHALHYVENKCKK